MGVFSDYVRKYYESGLVTIPCEDKRPIVGEGWQKYCQERIDESVVDSWESRFKSAKQIGLTMGPANSLAGFDFDYEFDEKKCTVKKSIFEKDRKLVEMQLLAILPPTPCVKTGMKGWTRIYRTIGQMENAQCDRYGLRLFDFLAKNKQTIIPPSQYNGSPEVVYRWLGPSIEDCFDEIPVISQDVVDEIKMLFSEGRASAAGGGGRHRDLFMWMKDVCLIEPDNEKIALAMVARDKAINKIPYLSDKKHHKTSNDFENALKWIERVKKYLSVNGTERTVSKDGWDYFFEKSFPFMKKDIISKDVYVKNSADEPWSLIRSLDGVLRAYAIGRKLKYSQTSDHLDRWIYEKRDFDFLCDIPAWDGVDRVSAFAKCVKSSAFTSSEICDILKHWGSNIFRRVNSPDNQNRVPVFKGPQGIGKDHLVRAMLRDFKPYYESTTLPGTQKDALEIVSRLLVVHIEEFDQTRNMDIAFLKSLITQPSAFFRESYGFAPSQKIMRPSFISTANVDDFLRDPTGNRRFIVIPVDSIDWKYPKDQSLMIMAQFKAICEASEFETLSKDLEIKIKSIIDAYTPEDMSESIIDLYKYKFELLTSINGPYKSNNDGVLSFGQISETLGKIAKDLNCSLRRVQSVIKGRGLSRRFNSGVKYFKNELIAEKNSSK